MSFRYTRSFWSMDETPRFGFTFGDESQESLTRYDRGKDGLCLISAVSLWENVGYSSFKTGVDWTHNSGSQWVQVNVH